MNGWSNWETKVVVDYYGDEAQDIVNRHGKTDEAEEALEAVLDEVAPADGLAAAVYGAFLNEVNLYEIIQAQDDPQWEIGDETTVAALGQHWVLDDDVAQAELGEEAGDWNHIIKTETGEFWGVPEYNVHDWTTIERIA